MPSSIITAKGQITIPKSIRERLGVDAGDRIDFVVRDDGTVVLEPAVQSVGALRGLLATKGQPAVTIAAMHRAIRTKTAKP